MAVKASMGHCAKGSKEENPKVTAKKNSRLSYKANVRGVHLRYYVSVSPKLGKPRMRAIASGPFS